MTNPSFSSWELENGLLYDYTKNRFPVKLYGFNGGQNYFSETEPNISYFGYVFEGDAIIEPMKGRPSERNSYDLMSGMYFSINSDFTIYGGKGIVIARLGEKCVNVFGGPIEEEGRLKYIDGCTDSLLIPPVLLGYSCLNHLHFPTGIDQTMHTHPSMRVGMVAKGSGNCVTPFGNADLYTGQVFIIHEETGIREKGQDGDMYLSGSHCFQTFEKTMDVIAFHPDSDWGPEHEEHPMINRTIVDGISAKYIDEIKT